MKNLVIKKNNEIDDVLLDEILNFDRTIFSVDEEYSFPDNYFRKIYQNSKDGIFVLLNNNNNVIGYVNCIFLSDEGKEKYILDRDYLSLENIGFNIGHNNMYLYNLVLKKEYRDTHVIKPGLRNEIYFSFLIVLAIN